MQLSLIQDTEAEPTNGPKGSGTPPSLRPYQRRILDEALSLCLLGKSPIIDMATGTGKTRTAVELVKALAPRRVLWVGERSEWLSQAHGPLSSINEPIGWEAPGRYSAYERIVLASKDTVRQPDRLERLKNYHPFEVLVFDEAHHVAARTYHSIRAAYPGAVCVGLSATVDRMDRRRLPFFDSATTPYGIREALTDAWLVRPVAKRVKVRSVDLSCIGYRAGDFAVNELDNLFAGEEQIHGCVRGILENVQSRPTIVFCPGLSSAHRTAEVLERYVGRPVSRVVTGTSSKDARADTFKHFGQSYQFLINVGIATEGTDLPNAACIAFLRPTGSRSLFAQMLGRGLRPGCWLAPDSTANGRADSIRNSNKPDCLVLDFVGVTGRHSVVTVADVLGGTGAAPKLVGNRIDTEAVQGASGTAGLGSSPIDVLAAIQAEEAKETASKEAARKRKEREAEKRRAITGKVTVEVTDAQLIGLGTLPAASEGYDLSKVPISPIQANELTRLGLSLGDGPRTAAYARKLILDRRAQLGLASEKQVAQLARFGPVSPDLTKKEATWKLLRRWKKL